MVEEAQFSWLATQELVPTVVFMPSHLHRSLHGDTLTQQAGVLHMYFCRKLGHCAANPKCWEPGNENSDMESSVKVQISTA